MQQFVNFYWETRSTKRDQIKKRYLVTEYFDKILNRVIRFIKICNIIVIVIWMCINLLKLIPDIALLRSITLWSTPMLAFSLKVCVYTGMLVFHKMRLSRFARDFFLIAGRQLRWKRALFSPCSISRRLKKSLKEVKPRGNFEFLSSSVFAFCSLEIFFDLKKKMRSRVAWDVRVK